ncbi:ShlB/FhaC/HecB family hemolysin secretion/activation protein [Endozoicomonas sp. SCSIO W0465]|uniref:ShlB/FhaC/HecB family hemolysin secretion/activation protein n=1 Tax=Endozoicomonas sp. SCSIO W0465 TaxID=2918516 RepID=UPI00207650D4|nr:ShlB/FhaC/HecB family hemolysin secretion/activation protein [Endozoicomonas sp. SCSIO W0465]USE37319.1 hypothetical protein MJO57_03575 [Endozoicomonas sp. SCSIO W0465]
MNTWTKKNNKVNQEDQNLVSTAPRGNARRTHQRWPSGGRMDEVCIPTQERGNEALFSGLGAQIRSTVLVGLLGLSPLIAQGNPEPRPDPAGKASKDLFDQEIRLREKEQKPSLPAITEQTEPTEEVSGGPTFILRGIRFTRSAHLTQEELQNIVQPVLGEEIDYQGLQKILATINQLYRQKNIYTAVAVFPEQQVADGVVIIQLVEGSIGEIVFEGNEYTEDDYLRQWINHDNQLLSIDISSLEDDILFYNRIHNQRLQAELRAGKAFGLTDIVIKVPEPGRNTFQLYLDNYGYESSGEVQLSALYQRNQLFRSSDKAMAYALASKGLKSVVGSYSTVLGTSGFSLGGSFQFTNAEVVAGDFVDTEYSGDTLRFALDGGYLLYSDTHIWINLKTGISTTTSNNEVSGATLSEYHTSRYQLGAELSWLGNQWQLTGQQLYSSVNSKEKFVGDNRRFNLFNTRLTFIYNFDNPFYALTTVDAQFASEEALPGSASFTLGGPSTLRGYQQGIASGDQGWYQQIELHYNGFSFDEYLFDLYGFYDHGQVESLNPKQTLSSAGVGINVSGNEWFSFDLTVANAMEEVVPDQDNTSLYARITCHCID